MKSLPPFLLAIAASMVSAETSIRIGQVSYGQIQTADLEVRAANDTWFDLQESTDLTNWQRADTRQVQLSGQFPFVAIISGNQRFYRVLTPPALRLSPGTTADIAAGGTLAVSAFLNGVANNAGVVWSVFEPGGGTVTAAGSYTAPAQAGNFHVIAVSKSDPAVSAVLQINVVAITATEQTLFADAAAYSESVQGEALLIMKNGAVVYERYNAPTTADSPHLLASGTKSFSAALFALGRTMGIWTLDENVSQTITEWQGVDRKKDITIRQLLSLSSGLLDSPLYSASPSVIATLDTYDLAINGSSTPQPPGTACIYTPANFQILAAMFERKTGLDPAGFLHDRLLSRLGFDPDQMDLWTRDRLGKPQMAGGAYFSARAWANYGKLWIQRGVFDGQTLLDPFTADLAVTYDNPAFKGYGFSWWLNLPTGDTYNPPTDQIPPDGHGDGTQIATNAPADTFMAAGVGKQRLYVIPSLGLVVVRFARGLGNGFSDHELLGKITGVP